MNEETIKETVKAVQEISKLGTVIISNTADLVKWAGSFLSLKDTELKGMVSDKL